MLPLRDDNPTYRRPYVTWLLIGLNILVFLYQQTLSPLSLTLQYYQGAVVPYAFTRDPIIPEGALDIVRSMFMHGSWAHILSNMLYLYIFGDNVEDRLGKALYIAFYLVCGAVAALAQVLMNTESQIPMVGASGAIAGVLGAYLVFYPHARILGLVFLGYFIRLAQVPALIVLGLWFLIQLFNAYVAEQTNVAFLAHIGGFIAGLVLGWMFTLWVPQPPPDRRSEWADDRRHYRRF